MTCKHIHLTRLDDPFALAAGGKTYVCDCCNERLHAEVLESVGVQMGTNSETQPQQEKP